MLEHPKLPEWLEISVPSEIPLPIVEANLDAGETQSIALALELHADAVLIDERLGRRVATSMGLRPMGLLGCLILAKREGHLSSVGAVIDELRSLAGCWFDEELIATILHTAGEN